MISYDMLIMKHSNGWRRINGPLHISSIFRSKCDIDSEGFFQRIARVVLRKAL